MAPHALSVDSKGSSSSASFSEQQQFLVEHLSNPFGATADPELVKGTIYTSPLTIVNHTIYSISSKIFSYDSVGIDNLLDSNIHNWNVNFDRVNSFGIKPFYNKFEVRSGASNAILGYFKKNGTNGQPLSIINGVNALTYMRPTLSSNNAGGNSPALPLAFNVSAIDFDFNSNSLVSNYGTPLNIARSLGYSIFTPLDLNNGVEIQHTTLLNHYLVSLIGQPSLNLFDGPNFIKYYSKFSDLLSVEELGSLYQNLLNKSDRIPANLDEAIDLAFENLNALTGEKYGQFEYTGATNPDTVLISYGTFETTQLSNLIKKSDIKSIGLVKIRVPVPFNQQKFLATLPKSTKRIIILDQKTNDENSNGTGLISDITSTLFLNGLYHTLRIEEFNYPLNFEWTPITISKILVSYIDSLSEDDLLSSAATNGIVDGPLTANSSPVGKYLLWGKDNGILAKTADKLALSLSLDDSKVVSIRNKFDNSSNGGIFQSQIISSDNGIEVGETIDSADLIILEDVAILNNYDILATSKPESTILLINSIGKITDLNEFVEKKLPSEFKVSLLKNHNKLVVIDLTVLKELDELNQSTKGFSEEFLVQLGFWRSTLPDLKSFIVNKLLQANGNGFELLAVVLDKFIQVVDENNGLKPIDVLPEWASLEVAPVDQEKKDEDGDEILEEQQEPVVELPFFPIETSFFPNPREVRVDSENVETNLIGYKELATKFTFSEAFKVKQELRPDLPVKNFVVKVQENKRLTPQEYSRNIFHIEFDIGDSGLTYDIGEALGIHGRNNEDDVNQFLKFYNLDADALIEINNKDDASILEIKSIKQILLDNLDFLGKPSKKFYESLSEFATSDKEREHLLKLSSSEGLEELKKRQEVDFDTYVDILQEFKSARPSFEELIKIINPLKRREYSIASSQKIHNRAIHLLIVVVDWVDSRGRIRYGQCSKYLSDLKIGEELVVSVKPSVMKLPKLTTQPIIMSGLGTGLAPFKAFIEEKIWQLQQGFEIGEIYLYLGSRHKKEEYLYGELWEAYKEAGILTHIGAAFSRDQPQKIYIQDKIRESIEDLTDAVCNQQGSFYLCGPTWPVPDITACLEDIIRNGAKKEGKEVKDVAKIVEDMKEEGRYILEVY